MRYVWSHPWGYTQTAVAIDQQSHLQRKMLSLPLLIPFQHSRGYESLSHSILEFRLASSYTGLVRLTTTTLSSYVRHLCHVQKSAFHSSSPHPFWFKFFSLLPQWSFLSLGCCEVNKDDQPHLSTEFIYTRHFGQLWIQHTKDFLLHHIFDFAWFFFSQGEAISFKENLDSLNKA